MVDVMVDPIHSSAPRAPHAGKSFSLVNVLARPWAVALDISLLIVVAIAAILAAR